MRTIHIGFTGGGSGGHIYPLIAVMEAVEDVLRDRGVVAQFHYFGARDQYAEEAISRTQHFHSIAAGKVRRYATLSNIIDIPKIIYGIWQALWKVFFAMPDVVFSKGGPGAFPVVLAAWFYRIPVVIHDSDMAPGLTNLASSFFAKRAAVSFAGAARYFGDKAFVTGTPVRRSLLARRTNKEEAKTRLDFAPDRPLILVAGGSQGAKRLNEFIIPVLGELLPVTQVLHQTGSANFLDAQKLATAELVNVPAEVESKSRYKAIAYLDEATTALAFSAADVIVGRAGSTTIFEAAAFGVPLVLIPIPRAIAGAQQEENAYAAREAGLAKVIEEDNLSPGIFLSELKTLLSNPEVFSSMQAAASKLYNPDAATMIAREVTQFIR